MGSPGPDRESGSALAAGRARALLAREPLEGAAFAAIAANADGSNARALHRIAVRRAPRQIAPRIWLANDSLRMQRFGEAMTHLDVLLRLSPPYRSYLYPRLVRLSADPRFADALATTLRTDPPWRAEFLEGLLREQSRDAAAGDALLAQLASFRALRAEEFQRWIDSLVERQHWPEAYAQWASHVAKVPTLRSAVSDGGFATAPSGGGFAWRAVAAAGVHLAFVEVPGTRGLAAHAEFVGRATASVGMEHPLLLPSGRYRLHVRMRASRLQGVRGLEWTVACGTRTNVVARSAPVLGTFDWRGITLDFAVPPGGCPGQWLQLANSAPPGAAQMLAGEVWFDDVSIRALDSVSSAPVATLEAPRASVLRSAGTGFAPASARAPLAAGDRLILASEGRATVAYASGCVHALVPGTVYTVNAGACGRAGPGRDSHARPIRIEPIPVLPEAEAWPVPPVGR